MVLIGAGSAVFTRGLVADLLDSGWEAELRLVDINPEALKVAEGLARKMIAGRRAPVQVKASVDRRDVLRGATAVITTIGVGGRRAWEQDVFVPRKHGVYQPVGDSVGPGGTSRALRMIPAMVDIARDVLDLCPDALFFNYGNPMTAVCRGVRKATGAPMVGLCHGVPWVGRYLARALGIDHRDFTYNAVGLNHLTWFVEAWHKGVDVMPRLREIAAQRVAGQTAGDTGLRDFDSGHAASDEPFSWWLMNHFGAFPSCLDRHVSEFFLWLFPHGKYLGGTLGVDRIAFEPVIAGGDKGYEEMKRNAMSGEPLGPDYYKRGEGEHEQVLEIIGSIRANDGRVYSANLPNQGQVPNLPLGAVLEAPARADAAGLKPVCQKPLPSGVAGTMAARLAWVEVTAEAALDGDRDKFIQALVLDGAVDSFDVAARLADDLLRAQAEYLPQFGRADRGR